MIKLPSGVDIGNLVHDLRHFSWEASDILLYYSQILKDSKDKSNFLKNVDNNEPVTIADLKVNDIIIQKINEKYKDINWGILSEENVKKDTYNTTKYSEWTWVLDPLDGTKDFIQGTGNYAMHLALNYKQNPYIGIVLIPEKDELWIANGERTWCEKRDGSIMKPHLSNHKTLEEMILVTSKNHRNKALKNLIKRINFKEVQTMGSIGCKIANILRGESDIYISLSTPGKSSPKDWDFAAPEAILIENGGAITNLDNEKLSYGNSKFEQRGVIIASNNRENHKLVCLQIKKVIEEFNILSN